MKGLILINAYFESPEYLYSANRLKEEFAKKGVQTDVTKNDKFLLSVENGEILSHGLLYNFCVYLDKDKYILSMLEKTGMPLFNSRKAILDCDDKMQTYIALAGKGIPMPKTLAGLLCYTENAAVTPETVNYIETLNYPIIVKESFGSQGNGVHLANNRNELLSIIEKLKCKPHLYQEYVKTSFGKDVRVIVIGGKVIGAMLRQGKDFRSNIGAGGCGKPFTVTPEIENIAVRTAETLGLDYCGIDLLFGQHGFTLCEVNSNAFFYAFEKTTGINVAEKYAEHILKKLNK